MSMGYKAGARQNDKDDTTVIYEYYACNINLPNWQQYENAFDGYIMIPLPLEGDLTSDDCLIKNASGTWLTGENDKDVMAIRLIEKISKAYKKTGDFPEYVGWFA